MKRFTLQLFMVPFGLSKNKKKNDWFMAFVPPDAIASLFDSPLPVTEEASILKSFIQTVALSHALTMTFLHHHHFEVFECDPKQSTNDIKFSAFSNHRRGLPFSLSIHRRKKTTSMTEIYCKMKHCSSIKTRENRRLFSVEMLIRL